MNGMEWPNAPRSSLIPKTLSSLYMFLEWKFRAMPEKCSGSWLIYRVQEGCETAGPGTTVTGTALQIEIAFRSKPSCGIRSRDASSFGSSSFRYWAWSICDRRRFCAVAGRRRASAEAEFCTNEAGCKKGHHRRRLAHTGNHLYGQQRLESDGRFERRKAGRLHCRQIEIGRRLQGSHPGAEAECRFTPKAGR